MKSPVYITGASMIGPQPGFDRDGLERVVRYDAHPLKSIEPDLKRYIDPMRGRRMAKVARIGIGCGLNALERAGVQVPEAIIVGTGLGCMESTERFFGSMIQQDEMLPNPTAFIQSTHNNVAGQLALAVKCTGANFTYLHRGLSFTSALLDGLVQVGLEGARHVLVGGAEVMTEDYFITQRHSGIWKQGSVTNLEVLGSEDRGALCGEGAAFFVLDAQPRGERPVRVADVDIAYRGGAEGMAARIEEFLQRNGLRSADIDLLMVGRGGDAELDLAYGPVEALFPDATVAAFKHLCGEFYVANAFGTWLAWSALTTGALPEEAVLRGVPDRPFRTVLICDHFQLKDHSLVLLRG
jgi:3-oxoacyl-[acyl-carrier-protein] synthase II